MQSPNHRTLCPPRWYAALASLHWPTTLRQPTEADAGLAALQACLADDDGQDTRFVCQWERLHPHAPLRPCHLLLLRTDEGSATTWYAVLPWPSPPDESFDQEGMGPTDFYLEVVNAQGLWEVCREGVWNLVPTSVWYGTRHLEFGSEPAPTWNAIGYHDPILAWDDAGYPMGPTFRPRITVTAWEAAHRLHPDVLDALLNDQARAEEDTDDAIENWEEHDRRTIFTLEQVEIVTRQLGLTSPLANS